MVHNRSLQCKKSSKWKHLPLSIFSQICVRKYLLHNFCIFTRCKKKKPTNPFEKKEIFVYSLYERPIKRNSYQIQQSYKTGKKIIDNRRRKHALTYIAVGKIVRLSHVTRDQEKQKKKVKKKNRTSVRCLYIVKYTCAKCVVQWCNSFCGTVQNMEDRKATSPLPSLIRKTPRRIRLNNTSCSSVT